LESDQGAASRGGECECRGNGRAATSGAFSGCESGGSEELASEREIIRNRLRRQGTSLYQRQRTFGLCRREVIRYDREGSGGGSGAILNSGESGFGQRARGDSSQRSNSSAIRVSFGPRGLASSGAPLDGVSRRFLGKRRFRSRRNCHRIFNRSFFRLGIARVDGNKLRIRPVALIGFASGFIAEHHAQKNVIPAYPTTALRSPLRSAEVV
jgi:hypothetical protein